MAAWPLLDHRSQSLQGALHVRTVAELYGIPVILHTDHCMRSWLPWFDGLIEANEKYFKEHGEPLFSSHMLDLSEEPIEENVATCVEYLTRMSKCNLLLEMELGVTGGEEVNQHFPLILPFVIF